MTSASELFYNRRSRPGRASSAALYPGGTPAFDFLNHHHPGRRHSFSHRRDPDGSHLPIRRSSLARLVHEQRPRGSNTSSDRVSIRADAGTSQAGPSSGLNAPNEINSRRSGHAATDRLPGSVLLARERLLERLRGVSLSGGRQSAASLPSNNDEDHNAIDDRWRLADVSDWGYDTLMHSSDISAYNTDMAFQLDSSKKKPPGLTEDMINRLDLETYSDVESADGLNPDCSICLESVLPGDKLLRLPCEHRFHSTCLNPWVRTCGDCPYCRKAIVNCRSETGEEKGRVSSPRNY